MQHTQASILRHVLLCCLVTCVPGISVQSFLSHKLVGGPDAGISDGAQVTTVFNLKAGLGVVRPPPSPSRPPPSSGSGASQQANGGAASSQDNSVSGGAAASSVASGSSVASSGSSAAPPQPASDAGASSSSSSAPANPASGAQSSSSPPASPSSSSGSSSNDAQGISSAPVGARMWKIDAVFEVSTTSPVFTNEYDASREGAALTVAERLEWAAGVPMSRFAFWFPAPGAIDKTNVIFCDSMNNEARAGAVVSRYASPKNTTFKCEQQKHEMNSTKPVFLQSSSSVKKPLVFEVGVYPASGVGGDTRPAVEVAETLVEISTEDDEPKRVLHRDGKWTYTAGPGVKFHGLLPGTLVSMPGSAFRERETSLPLGPNPGGHGAEPATPPPVPSGKDGDESTEAKQAVYLANVDSVVHETKKINVGVTNSLQELKDSLARASAVHSAWLNWSGYKPPPEVVELTGP